MKVTGAIIEAARKIIPRDIQDELILQLENAETLEAAPAGAVLMGMYMLEYVGFPRYIDGLLGEEHTTIARLREEYQSRAVLGKPLVPSVGIILSLVVADMIACPRSISPSYKFEDRARDWRTGPLLGIEPTLLNDDRIGRAMSAVGADPDTMEEVLFNMVMNAGRKAGIPLNKFILDTTVLELDGKFKDALKVVPGRGKNSFAQLIVSLVIASGSRVPVGFGVLAGNTSDSRTLPDVYETVNRVADDGAVEFLMDRIYPTPSNILFLREHEEERMVYWVSPLKMGLSEKRVRILIDEADREGKWKPVGYRSNKEHQARIDPPLTAFETTWILTEKVKPDLVPGQKRRARGSIKTIEIEVRCVFYRHALNAEQECNRRAYLQEQLEKALQDFCTNLNKRKYQKLNYCQQKLSELLNTFPNVKKFLQCTFSQTEKGAISLTWSWDEAAIEEEAKYDGVFALLTNYTCAQVNSNQLVSKYRSRDEVEVDIKGMKGILDLERVLYHRPERIECYIFLKVIAFFVLAFLRTYAEREGIKTTEKQIQESMGDILLIEHRILPLGIKTYAIARDKELNLLFRKLFSLPDPRDLIRLMSEAEVAQVDYYVRRWYEEWLKEHPALE